MPPPTYNDVQPAVLVYNYIMKLAVKLGATKMVSNWASRLSRLDQFPGCEENERKGVEVEIQEMFLSSTHPLPLFHFNFISPLSPSPLLSSSLLSPQPPTIPLFNFKSRQQNWWKRVSSI